MRILNIDHCGTPDISFKKSTLTKSIFFQLPFAQIVVDIVLILPSVPVVRG